MRGEDQVFADGIGTIAVTGSTVRVEFVSLMPGDRESGGQPRTAVTHRLVMPVEGFLASVGKLQETVQALVQRGIVRPQGAGGEPSGETRAAPTPLGTPERRIAAENAPRAEPPRAEPAPTGPKPAARPFP